MGRRKYHDAHPQSPPESMFSGSITALVTPFSEQGGVDYEALDRLVDYQLENGTDGLAVIGTTGESATMSREEVIAVMSRVIGRVRGRIPIMVGTGLAGTAKTVDQTLAAAEMGADAALVITPYYNRPPQRGLVAHFTAVADASPIPLVLYNVPPRTGVDMLPETVERLSEHPRIIGIKEAVGDRERVQQLAERCGPDFTVLSGDDPSCLQAIRLGGKGVVSVASNVAPAQMHALCTAALAGEQERADSLDGRLQALYEALALETNPIPVKWAVYEIGLAGPGIRLPLAPLDETHRDRLRRVLEELGLAH
jgi:4-hydroxy-tetrahydrodipicolinate synthase